MATFSTNDSRYYCHHNDILSILSNRNIFIWLVVLLLITKFANEVSFLDLITKSDSIEYFEMSPFTLFIIGIAAISWGKRPTTHFKKAEYVVGRLLQQIAVLPIINQVVVTLTLLLLYNMYKHKYYYIFSYSLCFVVKCMMYHCVKPRIICSHFPLVTDYYKISIRKWLLLGISFWYPTQTWNVDIIFILSYKSIMLHSLGVLTTAIW